LGEDEERDEEYKALYRKEMPKMDLILWMLAVNDRKNKDDIVAHEELVRPIAKANDIPVIFVANKADAAQPGQMRPTGMLRSNLCRQFRHMKK